MGSYLVAKSRCNGSAASQLKTVGSVGTKAGPSKDPSAATPDYHDLLDQAKMDMLKAIQQAPVDANSFRSLVRQQRKDIGKEDMEELMSVHCEATIEGSNKDQKE